MRRIHKPTWKDAEEKLRHLSLEIGRRGGSITDANSEATECIDESLENFFPVEEAWESAWRKWCDTGQLIPLPPAANRLGYIHLDASMQLAVALMKIYPDSLPFGWSLRDALDWLEDLNQETTLMTVERVRNDFLGVR